MKKITIMAFLLAVLAPITQVFGGHSTHYGKMTVAASPSGAGTVYLSTSKSGATSGDATYTWNCNGSSNNDSATRYCYAKANAGYKFTGWTGYATSTDNPYTLTLSAEGSSSSAPTTANMTANFKAYYNVSLVAPTVSAGFASYAVKEGSTSLSGLSSGGNIEALQGNTYTFTCNLKDTRVYKFTGWDVGGTTVSTANPYSRSFSAAATIKAVIAEKDSCTVTIAAPTQGAVSYTVSGDKGFDGAGLTAGGTFKAYHDETYTFTCSIADPGTYELAGWEVDGTVVTTDATLTRSFTPNTTATVKAVLNKKVQYRLTLTKPTGVTSYAVTGPTGADGLSDGGYLDFLGMADFTFNCTLDDNYKFLNWSVTDGEGTSAPTTRPLSKRVSSNTTVAAVVAPKEMYTLALEKPEGVTSYTVTATPGGAMGSLSAGGTATVRELDSYTFACTIDEVGYKFEKWTISYSNGTTENVAERTFSRTFTSDATVTAVLYKKGIYELTFVKPEQVTSFSITGPNGAVTISAEGKATVYELDSYTISCEYDGDNYEIVNWFVNDVAGSSADSFSTTFNSDATVTVTFAKIEAFIATCPAVPSGCSYKVGGETVTTADKKVKGAKGHPLTVTLSAASAGSGYLFAGWYIENADGSKTYISKDSSITQTFNAHVIIGADFVSSTSDKAALVVKASGGYGEYDDLKAAFDDLESGDSIAIGKSATLSESAAVPYGVTMTIPSGVTLTVASGQTLYVDGSVSNSGTISGTVSKCTKLIKQTGDGTDDTGKPKPFNPYNSVKYWKTAISSVTISGVSTSTTHISIVNGLGQTVYRGATANAFVCSVNTSIAWNHITGVESSKSLANDAYTSAKGGSLFAPAAKMVLLTANGTFTGSNNFTSGFTCDCAGYNFTISGYSQMNNAANPIAINGGTVTFVKNTNAKPMAINCSSVSQSSVNANSDTYSSQIHLIDCSTVSLASKWPAAGGVFIYSGTYTISFSANLHATVYGGYYKNDPTTYLATGLNLVATKDSAHNNYYWVHTNVPDKVAQIGDSTSSQYATLQEAVNAVTAGQTIKVLKNYDANETIAIASGKSFTLDLNGYAITGTSGQITNNGTLQIGDCSGGNGSCAYAIVNNGTMEVTYGAYSGVITLNSGMCTTHNGTFNGTFEFGSGVSNPADVLTINGGMFKKSVKNLLVGDFCEVTYNGLYYVGAFPYAIRSAASLSGAEKSWSLTAVTSEDRNIYMNAGKARSACSSDAVWRRYSELDSALTPYVGFCIDCVLSFDRAVAKGSVKAYANAKVNVSDTLDRSLAANESYRVLSPRVSSAGYAQISFARFITGNDCPTTLSAGIADVNSANPGTVATIELELCHSNRTTHVLNKDYVIATCRYMLGGKKAAIDRGANRLAYDSLTAAVSAVQDGETILVGADTSENVTFNNPGTYVINEYGFAFNGSATAKEGYDFAESTGTDSNGFVTHTYVVSAAGPAHPAEYVVTSSIPEAWKTENGLGSGSTTAQIQEVLKQDTNGNAKWENVVLGQNGATAAAIETSTNGTPGVAKMEVSFTAPENTGYTVRYAFDRVNGSGSVVANGEAQANPQLDLTQVTTAGEASYFKMRAVLVSNDGSITTNVPVANTIGVLKVNSTSAYSIIAVPWKSFDNGDVKVSELVHAASLSEDDQLTAYDSEGNSKSWRVKGGTWAPVTEVEGGQSATTPDPAGFGLARGKGVWLKRSDTTKPIYLLGLPPASGDTVTTTLASAANGEASWNLLASPKLEAVDIKTSTFKDNTGDEIIVPTAGTPKHYTYKDGAWGYPGAEETSTKTLPNGQTITVIKSTRVTDDTEIKPGTGFWYLNKGTGSKSVSW